MGIYRAVLECLEKEMAGSLLTVIEKSGAAPRETGAKMFVFGDGRSVGTIGGGTVEAHAIRQALDNPSPDKPTVIHFRMDGAAVEAEGMLCGGDVDILIEPVHSRLRGLYEAVEEAEKRAKRAVVVTTLGEGGHRKSMVDLRGRVWGDPLGGGEAEELAEYASLRGPIVSGERLIEPVPIVSRLIIFGAGHVSVFVARGAKMVNFSVTVVDDRAEFANAERFPEADEIFVDDFESVFRRLTFSEETYLVIVTRGHSHDALVLEEALKRPFRYVGMIGSTRKVRIVMDHLKKKGHAPELLDRVYAPIGLDIHSDTPEEIGVSIVAQMIQVRGETGLAQ